MAQFPRDQRAIVGDLVMLDGLGARNVGRIEHRLVFDFAGGCFSFLDQAIDRRAVGARRFLTQLLEHLVVPFDLLV